MKKYFYLDGKERFGPFSFEELKNENISRETLIWFEGLEYWVPAKDIDELEEILRLTPPPININDTAKKTEENDKYSVASERISHEEKATKNNLEIESISKNHPWRRFLARTVDLYTLRLLLIFIFSYLIGLIFPQNVDKYVKLIENPIIGAIILYLLWIPTEALFLYIMGTTPAKWLFGIHIKKKTAENLSFNEALSRAFQVFVYGEGFAIPLITLFTRIFSYRNLVKNGITRWDTNVGSVVMYENWSTIKIIASVIVTLLTLILLAFLNSGL